MRVPVRLSLAQVRLVVGFLSLVLASSSGARAGARASKSSSNQGRALAQANTPSATRPAPSPVTIELRAIADTVVAHQTAWIEVRLTNNTPRPLRVPFRSGKIPGEWKFTDSQGLVVVDWPDEKEMKDAPFLTVGPGEVLYDVLSPESSYGVLTNPGTVYAFCRLGSFASNPVAVSRRPATSTEHSALRGFGALHDAGARGRARVELWSLCGKGNDYFDCDEALFTVAWDRLMVSPSEAQSVVDSLVAQAPASGWCRPALYTLVSKLPEAAGRRYIEGVLARKPGGVAEACAMELLRRGRYHEAPAAGRSGRY